MNVYAMERYAQERTAHLLEVGEREQQLRRLRAAGPRTRRASRPRLLHRVLGSIARSAEPPHALCCPGAGEA